MTGTIATRIPRSAPKYLAGAALVLLLSGAEVPLPAQDGSEWDRARAQLIAGQRTGMAEGIARWKQLTASDRFGFSDYSSFLLTYPGFPQEDKLRISAERALGRDPVSAVTLVAYFNRYPPLTNPARGRYATALMALGQPQAQMVAIAAWRGGSLAPDSEAAIYSMVGSRLSLADHDARMDALLWAGDASAASREIAYVSPGKRDIFAQRLSMVQGNSPYVAPVLASAPFSPAASPYTNAPPESLLPNASPVAPAAVSMAAPVPNTAISPAALTDAGYVYNRVRFAQGRGGSYEAAQVLANRPRAQTLPLDTQKWVSTLLGVAKSADVTSAVRIAYGADDAFPAGADVSQMSFKIRDDYTSLVWLGGTKALWSLNDPARAAILFYRYGAAARSPATRSKGFYWSARALAKEGQTAEANRYLKMAAAYPDQFYGMLALERLSQPLPVFDAVPGTLPTMAQRAAFNARPLTLAVREVAREADWPTTVRFFREICDQAQTQTDHVLVANLAVEIGRRDLGVILGQSAHTDSYGDFQQIAFPLIPAPPGTDWTMVHALTRQESQFAQNAVSYAGARGLMPLMPGTAREQAGKVGLSYSDGSLLQDAGYNLRLGDAYFARMMTTFNGSYPLAVAAYNAGPGNVRKWLAANGDPRTGSIDWTTWIEQIPIYETRNYVQRVLENAVVYEAMNPARAHYRGPNALSYFLGKRTPG
jgi:soluble lytic murein transglycosylase